MLSPTITSCRRRLAAPIVAVLAVVAVAAALLAPAASANITSTVAPVAKNGKLAIKGTCPLCGGKTVAARSLYGVSSSPGSVKKRTLDGNANLDRTLYGFGTSPGKKRTLDNNGSTTRTLYGIGTSPGKKRTLDNNSSTARTLYGISTSPGSVKKRTLAGNASNGGTALYR